jgi:hypothetical protein
MLSLHDRGFGAKYLSRRRVDGGTGVPIRTKDTTGRIHRETTGFALPVSQLHPLTRVVRDHLTVETIPQRHESHGHIVQSVLVNVRKRRALDRLGAVVTRAKTRNCHVSPPLDRN